MEREVIREEPVVERERTTVIETGRSGGGGGALAALLLVLALAVILFLVFGRGMIGSGGDTDINVDVKAPDVELPKLDAPSK